MQSITLGSRIAALRLSVNGSSRAILPNLPTFASRAGAKGSPLRQTPPRPGKLGIGESRSLFSNETVVGPPAAQFAGKSVSVQISFQAFDHGPGAGLSMYTSESEERDMIHRRTIQEDNFDSVLHPAAPNHPAQLIIRLKVRLVARDPSVPDPPDGFGSG